MGDDQLIQNYKQCFFLADMDSNMEFLNQISGLNQDHTCALNLHSLMGFPDNISGCANTEAFPSGLFVQDNGAPAMDERDRKRKATDVSSCTPESSSSPQVSDNGSAKAHRGAGAGGRARAKKVRKEEEKGREVIHVRAKRGEATDSHSLAERVRRGKINERLRCLQDIVPGCYKTMGMAVMLDEIINYVQSLQNQVEFLSMRLTAASTFHDFNSDTDVMDAMHAQMQRAKALEALKGQQGVASATQFPQNFGYCPDQLPRTR